MNIMKLFVGAVLSVGLAAGAHAADTSSTVNVRKAAVPVGMAPQVGFVQATATNAANGFTFDLPVPHRTSNILGVVAVGYASGTDVTKPLSIKVNGSTVTVSGSNYASGTLAVGDYVKAMVIYQH